MSAAHDAQIGLGFLEAEQRSGVLWSNLGATDKILIRALVVSPDWAGRSPSRQDDPFRRTPDGRIERDESEMKLHFTAPILDNPWRAPLRHMNEHERIIADPADLVVGQWSAIGVMHHGPWPDPASEIKNATTSDDVISALRRLRLDEVADRVAELSRLHETDPDEPQLDVASLRAMAAALIRDPKLRAPQLTISEKGFMHAEWRTVEDGALAMTFLPSGRIEFGAISASARSGTEILRMGGLHLGDVTMNAVQWFTSRIVT